MSTVIFVDIASCMNSRIQSPFLPSRSEISSPFSNSRPQSPFLSSRSRTSSPSLNSISRTPTPSKRLFLTPEQFNAINRNYPGFIFNLSENQCQILQSCLDRNMNARPRVARTYFKKISKKILTGFAYTITSFVVNKAVAPRIYNPTTSLLVSSAAPYIIVEPTIELLKIIPWSRGINFIKQKLRNESKKKN